MHERSYDCCLRKQVIVILIKNHFHKNLKEDEYSSSLSVFSNWFLSLLSRFPDDEEKKNDCCHPLNAPQLPAQWWELNYWANVNGEKISKALGFGWMRNHRLTPLHHLPLTGFAKIMMLMIRNKEKISEKMKLFGEQEDMYGKFVDQKVKE